MFEVIDNLSGGVAKMQSSLNGFAGAAKAVGATLSVALTAPIVGAGVAALKSSVDFDKAMMSVNSVAKKTGGEFEALKKTVLDFSTTTSQGAVGTATALRGILASGLDAADGMKVLRVAVDAAGNMMSDTETTTRAFTSTLKAFGLSADDVKHVADVLEKAATSSAIRFDELTMSLSDVSGMASASKVPLEAVVAAMMTVADVGFTTSEAATGVRSLLQSILKPKDEMLDMFKKWGYESGEVALKTVGLSGVVQMLSEYTGGSSEKMLELVRRVEAGNAAFALAKNGGENFARSMDKISTASDGMGTHMQMADIRHQSVAYQMTRVKSLMESFAISIGNVMLPKISEWLTVLKGWAEKLNELDAPTKQSIITTGLLVAAIGPAIGAIGMLASTVHNLQLSFSSFATMGVGAVKLVGDMGAAFSLLRAGASAASVASTGFAGTLMVSIPVIAVAVAALAALAAAYKFSQDIKAQEASVGKAWTAHIQEQVKAGASAEDIMAEYAATQQRVNEQINAAPFYLRIFIDQQKVANEGAVTYVDTLSKTALSQEQYESETRKVAASMGLQIDAQGNLVKVTQAMGLPVTDLIQKNFLLSSTEREYAKNVANTVDWVERYSSANHALATAIDETTEATKLSAEEAQALAEAQAALADDYLSKSQAALESNNRAIQDRIDLEKQLSDLDSKIAAQGPARVEVTNKIKMTEEQLAAARSKMAAIQEDLDNVTRKKGETDLELRARTDALRASYSNLGTKIDQATGLVDTHTKSLGGVTKAQLEERQAILDKIAAIDEAAKHELAVQAIEGLTLEQFGGDAEKYAAAKRALMLATGLVTPEALAQTDAMTILGKAYSEGGMSAEVFAAALGRVKDSARDGIVSLKELSGPIIQELDALSTASDIMAEKRYTKTGAGLELGGKTPVKGMSQFAKVGMDASSDIVEGMKLGMAEKNAELTESMVNTAQVSTDLSKPMVSPIFYSMGTVAMQEMANGVAGGSGILAQALQNAIAAASGASGGSTAPVPNVNSPAAIAGMAGGGNVYAGVPAIVGERGPELFVPPGNGSIVPNGRFSGGSVAIDDHSTTIINDPVGYKMHQEEKRRRSKAQLAASMA